MEETMGRELAHERGYLDKVLTAIDSEIREKVVYPTSTAVDLRTEDAIYRQRLERAAELRNSRPSPYFGRVDFRLQENEEEAASVHYIGKVPLSELVRSWTAPVAALYYRPELTGYQAPKGYIWGQVELKRLLEIADAQLVKITDLVKLLPTETKRGAFAGDSFLTEALSASSSGELEEAVQTIQPEQYEQIAAVEKPVLIIQGSAGSGKSLVALHRLAYLLSPFNSLPPSERPHAGRVIMFGPSRAFLKYVASLLPSLGHTDIVQTTIHHWMLTVFSSKPRIASVDRIFSDLMRNRAKGSLEVYEAEAFKGSLQMAAILESYVKERKREILAGIDQLVMTISSGQVIKITKEIARRYARLSLVHPLNRARELFINQIEREAMLSPSRVRKNSS
ncbi:MAG: hypothetical protein HYU30_00345 [Chloroflexi bacterium]|nr:hypothetical protein [Chloroflexota bacterium]